MFNLNLLLKEELRWKRHQNMTRKVTLFNAQLKWKNKWRQLWSHTVRLKTRMSQRKLRKNNRCLRGSLSSPTPKGG